MVNQELATAPMHRICKKAGAERVSEKAAEELAKALEAVGLKIASEAIDYSMHAGRKTGESKRYRNSHKKDYEQMNPVLGGSPLNRPALVLKVHGLSGE